MSYAGVLRRFSTLVERFWGDRRGNYAIFTALAAAPLLTAVGVTVEFANASRVRSDLQQRLDAAVLAGARERENKVRHAEDYFTATYDRATTNDEASDTDEGAEVWFELGDGVLDGWARRPIEPVFLSSLAAGKEISIHAQARFAEGLPPRAMPDGSKRQAASDDRQHRRIAGCRAMRGPRSLAQS